MRNGDEKIKQEHSGFGDNVKEKNVYQFSIENNQINLFIGNEKKYTLCNINTGDSSIKLDSQMLELFNMDIHQDSIINNYYDFSIESVVSINMFFHSHKIMRHKNYIQLKALKNNLLYYYDTFQTDGKIYNIKTYPNLLEKIKYEESLLTVKYRFPKVLNCNDLICHKLSCEYIESFQNNREYWIMHPISPTKSYYIKFISPHNKPFKSVIGLEKYNNFKEKICNIQPKIRNYGKNRNCFIWELKDLKKNVKYKLEWDW